MLSTLPARSWLLSKAKSYSRRSEGGLTATRVSDTDSTVGPGTSSRCYDPLQDQMGLTVLHEPQNSPSVDIVFVHGLGGKSQRTWAKGGKPELFWPKEWLPLEEGISNARISTYGYDANFMSKSAKSTWTISDFANELLFWLGSSEKGSKMGFGKIPVIFIAHSMGGLVVKKACILGTSLERYKTIARSTTGIIFLSTPHGGSDLANLLDLVLGLPFLGQSPKPYISELVPNSVTLREINSQFWPLIPDLTLASFYETLPTPIRGLVKKTILEKQSAIFGYPDEIQKPLKADHHDVCKYSSTSDINYVSVLNTLKQIVVKFQEMRSRQQHFLKAQELNIFRKLLGIFELPDKDHQDIYGYYMPGSCQKFISDPIFQTWIENLSQSPHIIWANGPSGVGKSVLSSYIIQYLKERAMICQFYYFRLEKEEKRLRGGFLRSLAYQIANDIPKFREQLALFLESPEYEQSEDGSDIWRRLFTRTLFGQILTKPMYWILDGIDTCNSPHALVNLIAPLSASGLPLRVMFLSRRTNQLSTSFQKLSTSVPVTELHIQTDQDDLNRYVQEMVGNLRIGPEFIEEKEEIRRKVLSSAKGNFRWTRLVLERLLQCRRKSEFEAALEELHPELSLYRHMDEDLTKTLKSPDLELARMALTWNICSKRQLTIQELSEALQSKEDPIYDLPFIINEVCGGFMMVNRHTSQITTVHHSAQEYLTTFKGSKLHIDLHAAHSLLFRKCLSILSTVASNFLNQDLAPASLFEKEPLLQYAAFSWFYHLSELGATLAGESFADLDEFLNGPYLLVWVSMVASCSQLQPIVEAAEALSSILPRQQQKLTSENCDSLHRQNNARIAQRWSIDLLQLTAKFGHHLTKYPRSIYRLIPAFSPLESMIHKSSTEFQDSATSLSVTGFSRPDWDDCLARFSVRKNCMVSQILCTDDYFAVSTMSMNGLSADGRVTIYRTRTCEELQTLTHGEAILNMQFSAAGRLLATASIRHIKVWTIPTDPEAPVLLLYNMSNPGRSRLLALAFTICDQSLIICSQDGSIRRISFKSLTTGWDDVGVALSGIGTLHSRAPSCAAFNYDTSLIAVGFRGAPTTVWDLTSFEISQYHHRTNHTWTDVRRIEWNSKTHHLIGVYYDGCIFKWNPKTDEAIECQSDAIDLKCSHQGNVFATSNANFKLTIWDFDQFVPSYQLALPSRVTGLAINPDGRRIYELGGSYCTIWQPVSLMCQRESSQSSSSSICDTLGIAQQFQPLNNSVKRLKDITALAVGPKMSKYCVGNMDGDVQIFKKDSSSILSIPAQFTATIEHVAWSLDEKYVAFADFGCRILIKDLSTAEDGEILEKIVDTPVRQLLFKKSSNVLLAVTQLSLYIWTIPTQSIFNKSAAHTQYRWINHPQNDELMLGFAMDTLSVLRWEDLEQEFLLEIKPSIPLNLETPASEDVFETSVHGSLESISRVEKLFTSSDGSIFFLQVSQSFLPHRTHNEYFVLHTAGITNPNCDAGQQSKLVALPQHLQVLIQIPLGFVNGQCNAAAQSISSSTMDANESHLAFINSQGWICTMYLGSADVSARVKMHYFLPRDWLVKESLELAQISAAGTLFCPKNGEVGVIQNGLATEWTE